MANFFKNRRKAWDIWLYGPSMRDAYAMDDVLSKFNADNVWKRNKVNYGTGTEHLRDVEYDHLLSLAKMGYAKNVGGLNSPQWYLTKEGVTLIKSGGMKVKHKGDLNHVIAMRVSILSLILSAAAVALSIWLK